MVVIIDYGLGNVGSILNMLKKIGKDAIISSDPNELSKASVLILPGVGAFDSGMSKLRDSGIQEIITKLVVEQKKPILGICLGMQLLFDSSEEGEMPGLGWIRGVVKKFNFSELEKPLSIPHMGWNIVNKSETTKLFDTGTDEIRFYFVHSYHVECQDKQDIIGTAYYGKKFTCAVRRENICGVQFHPEKSHKFGMGFFQNFLEEFC